MLAGSCHVEERHRKTYQDHPQHQDLGSIPVREATFNPNNTYPIGTQFNSIRVPGVRVRPELGVVRAAANHVGVLENDKVIDGGIRQRVLFMSLCHSLENIDLQQL